MAPAWVIDMLKELTAEGKSKGITAGGLLARLAIRVHHGW